MCFVAAHLMCYRGRQQSSHFANFESIALYGFFSKIFLHFPSNL